MFISEAIKQMEEIYKTNGEGHIYIQCCMELNPNFSVSDMQSQDDVFSHYVILGEDE